MQTGRLWISDKSNLMRLVARCLTLLSHGDTSLLVASSEGYEKVVDILLKAGANREAVNR